MYSTVTTAIIHGIDSVLVKVEADVSDGMPMFNMVGFLAAEVKEAKDRVRTALRNSGYTLPVKRITVNISPASIRKSGSGFDLPIAIAILAALGAIESDRLVNVAMVGELSLNGELKNVNGVLSMVLAAKEAGIGEIIVPRQNFREASLVPDMEITPMDSLNDVMLYLTAGIKNDLGLEENCIDEEQSFEYDFANINGQVLVRRACEIAASGMHNFLMIGPPGAGKSMIAKSMPSILPPLTDDESIELSKIYSVSGLFGERENLIDKRPFRSPHHTISINGLTGGGTVPKPGEISLAHRGVLFLDELPEFQKSTIEILRQPMEDKKISIVRVGGSFTFPADFMLVGAMNPCPCGNYPDFKHCRCTNRQVMSYLGKISQPLLDRIDITVEVPKISFNDLSTSSANESSEEIRKRVVRTHTIQMERFKGTKIHYNSQIPNSGLERYCALGDEEQEYAKKMYDSMELTARSYHRILKVARTIADIEESKEIKVIHLKEAMCYRGLEKKYWESLI